TSLPVDPGLHTVSIRFAGRARADEALADIDWVRIGRPDDQVDTYGAPTLRDIVAPAAALSGIPHRAIALRAPGLVRCPIRPSRSARLRVAIGVLGNGEGEAEVRFVRDGVRPTVLYKGRLRGGDRTAWTDIELPLG